MRGSPHISLHNLDCLWLAKKKLRMGTFNISPAWYERSLWWKTWTNPENTEKKTGLHHRVARLRLFASKYPPPCLIMFIVFSHLQLITLDWTSCLLSHEWEGRTIQRGRARNSFYPANQYWEKLNPTGRNCEDFLKIRFRSSFGGDDDPQVFAHNCSAFRFTIKTTIALTKKNSSDFFFLPWPAR